MGWTSSMAVLESGRVARITSCAFRFTPASHRLPSPCSKPRRRTSWLREVSSRPEDYAKRFHTPFVFSTNGHLFAEFAEDTQHIRDGVPLAQFPSPDELRSRYEALKQIALSSDAALALFINYKGGELARWYFQDAAIRAVLERIAAGQTKLLLSLATGTGKTVIASQLLWKEAQAGRLRRALFVCDRDELRTQGMGKLHAIFGDNAQEVSTADPKPNARVLVATYQTLNISEEDAEPRFRKENYPPDYFSHIIIDECHRSAWPARCRARFLLDSLVQRQWLRVGGAQPMAAQRRARAR